MFKILRNLLISFGIVALALASAARAESTAPRKLFLADAIPVSRTAPVNHRAFSVYNECEYEFETYCTTTSRTATRTTGQAKRMHVKTVRPARITRAAADERPYTGTYENIWSADPEPYAPTFALSIRAGYVFPEERARYADATGATQNVETGNRLLLDGALGIYFLENFFRFDLSATRVKNLRLGEAGAPNYGARVDNLDLTNMYMGNLYAHLFSRKHCPDCNIAPYIMGGLGATRYARYDDDKFTRFTSAAGAGIDFYAGDHFVLDLGYRHYWVGRNNEATDQLRPFNFGAATVGLRLEL
ncbi:MAG: outer membrane beta-barrel protein [Alphaproteobacteria bacterium]|nr:outer membrane beta-barrel protein [Alphaproteobacteria bacterium]